MTRVYFAVYFAMWLACAMLVAADVRLWADGPRPHIVLVMADDQGWGETGYYNHPVLKTPALDALAEGGLRFDRFYAGGPVCSPTRATVLTGRSHNRTGVETHGYALRRQEKTLPEALRQAGYATAHFGKWHLNGLRGPGVPILADDDHRPGVFGFEHWLSVTNFFDRNPVLSRMGNFEEYQGDSSEIVVAEALEFIAASVAAQRPSFTVIWFGTPHSPFIAAEEDMRGFQELKEPARNHYGELVAMDRSLGTLHRRLRELKIVDDTLLWFCSDNGGLPNLQPSTVGGLRGFKGSLYEGGLRVPAVVHWPAGIDQPRTTEFPACTMDIFPTIVDLLELPEDALLRPLDGISLRDVFSGELAQRRQPIPFNCFGDSAWLDGNLKLLEVDRTFELYDLATDPQEMHDLIEERPQAAADMIEALQNWQSGLKASIEGHDYPERSVNAGEPQPRFWADVEAYRPFLDQWSERPEYRSQILSRRKQRE